MPLRGGRRLMRARRHDAAGISTKKLNEYGYMFMLNMRLSILAAVLCAAGMAQAQAPVEDRGDALRQGQYRAGVAHRELEQARHDAKLAEQDVLNLRDAHTAAQQQADLRKRELDAAQKTLEAARGRLAATQKTYDQAVNAVDAAHSAAKQGPLGGAAPVAPLTVVPPTVVPPK
jgi:hypothetical protein